MRWLLRRLCLAAAAAGVFLTAIAPQAGAEDFYAGKTLTIICGYPPGGGVDASARMIARHLPRFIPGNPSVVVQNMPGAGGLLAANHLYAKAERGGLILGLPGRDWALTPTLQQPGGLFDALKFSFIGSTGPSNTVGWVRADLGYNTLSAWKTGQRKVVIGALTPNTVTASMPNLMAAEGFPIQVVTGYRGTIQILQAIEQGEVHGIVTNLATFARRPDLVDKTVVRLFQTLPEVKGLPLLDEAIVPEKRPLLRLLNASSAIGMPFVAPPEVPAERLAVLRQAFIAMARDGNFIAEANTMGEPTDTPLEGERVRALYADIIGGATPAAIMSYKELTGQR
jgi:tripartite-type tricarboxylate transporter receptor subunit TctC